MEVYSSKYRDTSFTSSMIFEYAMTIVFTFLAIGLIAMYFLGRMTMRSKNVDYEKLIILVGIIAGIATLISIYLIRNFRNIWYCVGFEFNDESSVLKIVRRKLSTKTISTIEIPYAELRIQKSSTPGFLFITQFSGYELRHSSKNMGWFLSDHFTWEEQGPDIRDIIAKLESIAEIKG